LLIDFAASLLGRSVVPAGLVEERRIISRAWFPIDN